TELIMKETQNLGPKGLGSDVKGELIKAGCALYEERGFDSVSLREIAERAGVNQAMVRYYFKDKLGFETAMLDGGFEKLITVLAEGDDFQSSTQAAISLMNTMPWMPILIMRTVYVSDTLRAHFIEKHASRLRALLMNKFEPPAGLNPAFVVMSVIALIAFPQLARPAVSQIFNLQFDDQFAADYAAYMTALFAARE
ncbi:MAG: helix-turn-helix domain-containing protein, partial [Pseudomonadota bacterium]